MDLSLTAWRYVQSLPWQFLALFWPTAPDTTRLAKVNLPGFTYHTASLRMSAAAYVF